MSRALDHLDAALAAADQGLPKGCQCSACSSEEDFRFETGRNTDPLPNGHTCNVNVICEACNLYPPDLPSPSVSRADRGSGISNDELFSDQDGPYPNWVPISDDYEIDPQPIYNDHGIAADGSTEAEQPTFAGTLTAHQHRMQPVEQWRLDNYRRLVRNRNNNLEDDP